MKFGLCLIRTSLALWICLGAHLHLSLDHAAYLEHAAEGHGVAPDGKHETLECACCVVTSSHRHHGHHVEHDHEINAVAAKPSPRALQHAAVAIVPLPPVEV